MLSGTVVASDGMSIRRAKTGPVMEDPSGFFAIGTVMVWKLARGVRSPCQPLTTLTCPSGDPTGPPAPRLGTL